MKDTKELLTNTIKALNNNINSVNETCTNLSNYKSLLTILQESREHDNDCYSVIDILKDGLQKEIDNLGDVHIELYEEINSLSEKMVDEEIKQNAKAKK
jgi:prefoldin subunit 5